ncbi:MAG: DUF11 domain-containing protein [Planctomycetaceae bacterium]|jgi:uncharacterized repeat protein (TIGR01451 family)|nr:DUF11 domain-containing protein [Planctomycetaceae bacterium]
MRNLPAFIIFLLLEGMSAAQRPDALYPGFPGEPIKGYYQPVMINAPEGIRIAGTAAGRFTERIAAPYQAGFLIGPDYRLRITDIPFHAGKEIYPTLTLLARTYPPPGKELDFPVMINITQEDLELALEGRYIMRVIYLEDPTKALPVPTQGNEQISFDTTDTDPIAIAATRGTPIALLRLGGRVPVLHQTNSRQEVLDPAFCFGSPPWVLNRTIPPEFRTPVPPTVKKTNSETITVDASLKSAGQSVLDEVKRPALPNTWQPGNGTAADSRYSSEYLADGGDAGMPVAVNADWSVRHFYSEDTVAHYDTLDGKTAVSPSNRIRLYAPRFGAVRKIEGLRQEGQITGIIQTNGRQIADHSRSKMQISLAAHEAAARLARNQDQLNSIGENRRPGGMETAAALSGYNNFEGVDAESMILRQRTFGLGGHDRLKIERAAVCGRAWMGIGAVRVQFNASPPVAASNIEGAAAYFQIDDQLLKIPNVSRLRLIKIASKDSALPGENVDFTIRFDNTGNALIGNVTILDSLTGRLEFVPGSAMCSLKSGFIAETNESGSLALRFEITDPLPPGEFGVIRFQCRVR